MWCQKQFKILISTNDKMCRWRWYYKNNHWCGQVDAADSVFHFVQSNSVSNFGSVSFFWSNLFHVGHEIGLMHSLTFIAFSLLLLIISHRSSLCISFGNRQKKSYLEQMNFCYFYFIYGKAAIHWIVCPLSI